MNSVAIKLRGKRYGLVSEFHDSSHPAAKGHRPLVATGGLPVRGKRGLPSDVPTLLQIVVDEILQQELIHIRTAARARHRPDIIYKDAQSPVAELRQNNNGRSHSQLPLPKKR